MAGRNRWTTRNPWTTQNPDDPKDSGQDDYRPQEIKKNGKYTTPNAAKVTKSKDQGYSEEENNASHGGTRPEKTISSTVEQASTLKEIKNRQEDIPKDHKPEYNHGIHRDTGPDLTKKESSSPEQAAGVQKREGKQKTSTIMMNNSKIAKQITFFQKSKKHQTSVYKARQ
ncbi:hypothetical protein LWI29_002162 [Acer saccharum]|uniref:Uncharacterized protein n=1 Tax=Acer saccharum TaxID=4024 RepID=A0AA39T020_ACESA|nr:hypothetical protein LWI29_002162 [Acer saccharum]